MRTLLSALVIGGLVFAARPTLAAEADPLAPLTEEDPLAPLTAEPAKPKPAKPKPRPKPPPPDKPARPPPPDKIEKADKAAKPGKPDKVEVVRKVNADRIKVSGVPPMPLKPGQSATLTFKVMDANGRPVASELSLVCNIGTITAAVETAPGVFTATYAPPATGTDNIVTIRADVKNSQRPVYSETKLGVSLPPPAPPKPALVAADPEARRPRPAKIAFADVPKVQGTAPVKVRFQVEDEKGNVIPPDGVSLKAESGTFENVREESGTYVADFVPSPDGRSGDFGIYAESSGGERLAGAGTITVAAATTSGRGDFGVAAGILVGGLTNSGKLASAQIEINVEARIFRVVRVGVLAGFSPGFASGVVGKKEGQAVGQADFNLNVIPLMVRAAYQQPVGPIEIYAGGMIGAGIVTGTGTPASGGDPQPINKVALDMAAFIGGGLPLGPGEIVLELRASWMQVGPAEGDPVRIQGNLGGFSGSLGYKFEF